MNAVLGFDYDFPVHYFSVPVEEEKRVELSQNLHALVDFAIGAFSIFHVLAQGREN